MQDGKKTAKNLHEAFYIVDKISHKSNFSPTEGGVFWQAAQREMICSLHTIGVSSEIKSTIRLSGPSPSPRSLWDVTSHFPNYIFPRVQIITLLKAVLICIRVAIVLGKLEL